MQRRGTPAPPPVAVRRLGAVTGQSVVVVGVKIKAVSGNRMIELYRLSVRSHKLYFTFSCSPFLLGSTEKNSDENFSSPLSCSPFFPLLR